MMTVQDIYDFLDEIAPFSTQEKWDNSGLLVGSAQQAVRHVMVTLDISAAAVQHAAEIGCDLIISHHPVIFSPVHNLPAESAVYRLAANGIAAICSHTPMDVVQGGINDILVEMLGEQIAFIGEVLPLDDVGCGRIVTLETSMTATEIAEAAKKILGCQVVRCLNTGKRIRRLGICSGSGASMLEEVAGTCDALLTGDVKHDRWIAAQDLGISLIDCGHYHTEIVMVNFLAQKLREHFANLQVTAWEGGDPVSYV